MRAWLAGIAALLLLAGSAAYAVRWLPGRIDPLRLRAVISAAVAQQLDSAVSIEGDVTLSMFPQPMLETGRVSLLHGSPGDPDGIAMTAETLRAHLSLPDLLHGRLAAADLVLHRALIEAPYPFDVRALTVGRPAALGQTTISLEQSQVQVGAIDATDVDATLTTDKLTGAADLAGRFQLAAGSAWRGEVRLSPPGGDGSATVNATLHEIDRADGLSASLAGQLSGEGQFAGRLTASGPDLARLVPGAKTPFKVSGKASFAGGVAALVDADLTLGDAPAHISVTWSLDPARLDVRLAASRIDLDAWRIDLELWRAALAAKAPPLPIELDISAGAVTLAAGTLRDVRLLAEAANGTINIRRADAVLPGEMTASLAGEAVGSGRFTAHLLGSNAPATTAWLAALLGRSLPSELKLPQTLEARAALDLTSHQLALHDLDATLDGARVRGQVLATGPGPNLTAILAVDQLDATSWQDGRAAAALTRLLSQVDATIRLSAEKVGLGPLQAAGEMQVAIHAGTLAVDRLDLAAPDWRLSAHGTRDAAGTWSKAALSFAADRADVLVPLLPAGWRDLLARLPLAAQGLRISATGSGTAAAPAGRVVADLGLLHVEASPTADVAAGTLRGSVSATHPDARAMAADMNFALPWLGDGGLAVRADVVRDQNGLSVRDAQVRAGALDAHATLRAEAAGLSGRIDVATVALPPCDPRSTAPMPELPAGLTATLDVALQRSVVCSVLVADLRARITLAQRMATMADVSARVAGGRLQGHLRFDSAGLVPHLEGNFSLQDAALGALSAPVAVTAARLSLAGHIAADGHAPAALLATLSGEARATLQGAVLLGLEVGGLSEFSDAAVQRALGGGRTVLSQAAADFHVDHGLATLLATGSAAPGASLDLRGAIDLPSRTADLAFTVHPALPDAPSLAAHIGGPWSSLAVAPELAPLARWRAAHAP